MAAWSGIAVRELARAAAGADYGEVFLEQSESTSVRFEDSRVADAATGVEQGAGLRFLRRRAPGAQTLQGSANSLDEREILRLRGALLGPAPERAPEPAAPLVWRAPVRVDPREVPLDEKIALLRRIDAAVRSRFPHIRQVSLTYGEGRKEVLLVNSEGAHCRALRTAVMLSLNVVAQRDGMLQTGQAVLGGLKGYELLLEGRPEAAAEAAARRALAKLDAPKAKAGEMAIVISSSAGGTLIHEAVGHALEADLVQEGTSPAYQGQLGRTVAPANVTVIDDPTLPGARGSFGFDDEAVVARPTPLIKSGVLVDYLYDRVSALKAGRASNGHGRRESFHCRPIPRMSNLYIAPGADDPADILAGLKAGLLVTRMGGGQVNTATGEFVFEVDEGYWVEDGVVRHLVRDANLMGVGSEALRGIDRVGWDIGWGIGTCGKDGQGVPVSDGMPTIRMPGILVGGRHE
ncbi:MAG: TldD/PmbA family protein [Elusimicrobia bacterium]|nr:TldD/PmbA family protein [Elusimicrobiota bacterium]